MAEKFNLSSGFWVAADSSDSDYFCACACWSCAMLRGLELGPDQDSGQLKARWEPWVPFPSSSGRVLIPWSTEWGALQDPQLLQGLHIAQEGLGCQNHVIQGTWWDTSEQLEPFFYSVCTHSAVKCFCFFYGDSSSCTYSTRWLQDLVTVLHLSSQNMQGSCRQQLDIQILDQ